MSILRLFLLLFLLLLIDGFVRHLRRGVGVRRGAVRLLIRRGVAAAVVVGVLIVAEVFMRWDLLIPRMFYVLVTWAGERLSYFDESRSEQVYLLTVGWSDLHPVVAQANNICTLIAMLIIQVVGTMVVKKRRDARGGRASADAD